MVQQRPIEARRSIEDRMKTNSIARAMERIFNGVEEEALYLVYDQQERPTVTNRVEAQDHVEQMLIQQYRIGLGIVANHEKRVRPHKDAAPLCMHVLTGKISYLSEA